ncbi:MAG: alpha/beta hydrolase [Sulfuriferula sp.]
MPDKLSLFVEIETGVPADASAILLHGGGGSSHEFAILIPDLASENRHLRFVLPNAPLIPLTLFDKQVMRAWYDVLHDDLEQDQDEESLRAAEKTLLGLIEREKMRGIPSSRILIGGFSQGAAIALHTGLRYREALAGILVMSAYLPLAGILLQEVTACSKNTPILIVHGAEDELVSIELAHKGVALLQELGYQVEWQVFPMGHSVCSEEISLIKKWIDKILG